MSTLIANSIVTPDGKPLLNSTGNIIQVVTKRSDTQTIYSSLNSGNGTTITELNMTITPLSASSRLIMTWHVVYEVYYENIFVIHRDGALITDSGEEGYNSAVGNVRYSGYVGAPYENAADAATTPAVSKITYGEIAGSTTARTYAPAIRASGATSYTLYLNRSVNNPGDNAESGVSFGRIYEVAA
jgi:hypothetical protein